MASIERRKRQGRDGRPYTQYLVRYYGADGTSRSRSFRREWEAKAFRVETEADLARGGWVDPVRTRTALAAFARERWLPSVADRKPKTRAGYESLLEVHVLPAFGHLELRQVDTRAVGEWLAGLGAAGLSPSRVRQARQVLQAIMRAAVAWGWLARDPVAGTRAPRVEHREMRALTAVELERLADEVRPDYRALVLVLGYGGLRWGEAVGLQVGRVDLLRARLEVADTLTEVGGRLETVLPKSGRRRQVTLPRSVAGLLSPLVAGRGAEEYLFTGPGGGPLRHSNFSRRIFAPAVARCGLAPLRVHDLRHTAASLLIAGGAHPKMVQEHLGHASVSVTLDRYGHLFPAAWETLGSRLEETRQAAVREAGMYPACTRPLAGRRQVLAG